MEFCLQNADILDEKLEEGLSNLLVFQKEKFVDGQDYELNICFDVERLNDSGFDSFNVPKHNEGTKDIHEGKIYDVLSYQLKKIVEVFVANNISVHKATIKGDYLDENNTIKITIKEDFSKPMFSGRGKNKRRMNVFSIIPSAPYINGIAADLKAQKLKEIYNKVMEFVGTKKKMSAVLGINETDDDKRLIKAFIEQYANLWPVIGEEQNELRNQLSERILAIKNLK